MAEKDEVQAAGASSLLARMWDAVTKDGTLAAAWRQGADEIGVALKAFPDSIHAEEPGGLMNPTQGEIAADRKPKLPSPSEIARDKQPYTPENNQDHGHGMGRE
jgi:hypothetical protein